MTRKYVLLADDRSALEVIVHEIGEGLTVLKQKYNYFFATESAEEADSTVSLHWLEYRKKETRVSITDDRHVPARYLTIVSSDTTELERTFEEVSGRFNIVPLASVLRQARTGLERNPGVAVRLALATQGDFDEDVFEILINGLRHANPDVRIAALDGIDLICWQKFTPILEATRDAAEDVGWKQKLETTLQHCQQTD